MLGFLMIKHRHWFRVWFLKLVGLELRFQDWGLTALSRNKLLGLGVWNGNGGLLIRFGIGG